MQYRDLNQVWEVVTHAGFFVAPIIYPLEILPERLHVYLYLWPPTPIILFSRSVLVDGQMPSLLAHALLTAETLRHPGGWCGHLQAASATGRGAPLMPRGHRSQRRFEDLHDSVGPARHRSRARARSVPATPVRDGCTCSTTSASSCGAARASA